MENSLNEVRVLEEQAKSLPQVETPTEHFFTTGLYTRQTTLPAGTVAVGKRHRDKTLNILLSGTMTVVMDNDPTNKVTLTGPMAFESEAGVKKIVYCHTPCIVLNVHRSDETELEALEAALIVPEDIEGSSTELGYELLEEAKCHG